MCFIASCQEESNNVVKYSNKVFISLFQPQSLACLTAWYVALASIDGQHEEGQEWGRGRAFLVDLLFHHPGTAHLSILTAARTCRGLFLKHVHYRG